MGSIFIIDEHVEARLTELREYCEAHPVSTDTILDAYNTGQQIGDDPNHFMESGTHRIVFSVEELRPDQLMRHLSVSVLAAGRVPAQQVVTIIMEHLGFTSTLEDAMVTLYPCGNGQQAVHVLEPYNP